MGIRAGGQAEIFILRVARDGVDHVANACRNGPRRLPYVAAGEGRVVAPKEIAEVNKKL